MKKTIYIETTIPSFYFEVRKEPEMLARKNWSKDWWDKHSKYYQLVTSEAVLEELSRSKFPNCEKALKLAEDIPLLQITEEIIEIVQTYINHHVMPTDPTGDALHLAIASFHKCDFLLTWNCKHLANANKLGHIRRINMMLGLATPELVTPLELIDGE